MDELENYLHKLDYEGKELIVSGDLNCDAIHTSELDRSEI